MPNKVPFLILTCAVLFAVALVCWAFSAERVAQELMRLLAVPDPVTDGGGMTGALLISPFVTPNTVDETNQFNHYSYLRSMEDLFGITTGGTDGLGHLGYAGEPGLVTF